MIGAIPGDTQYFPGIVIDDSLADVGPGTGGIDASRVIGLQYMIRRPERYHRMKPARRHDTLSRADVVAGDACPCRTVSDVEWRETGIVGCIFEVVCRTERFIHNIDQPAEVLQVLDTITVFHRHSRSPDPGLCMAAHAVRAHQIAGVANSAFDTRPARPVGQPGIDLAEMIVHCLTQCHTWIVIRSRFKHSQFNLISRSIRLGPQEIDSARLEYPVYRRAMSFILLVDALILITPLSIFIERQE